ncbi:MAG TPA: polyprenyl synthetase family protein [Spirochaetota bacterium]|nr:polyprenyl synthetase family protein [Spirochaetota bacterium]HPC39914.1 polyprenyl synthetase family protein [Spirochaetota bacterium]HQF08910.1 polyprenyl synthetase family protein [Spirochaetota bacterium]HQH97836.1 polyprenyl synthetase family protein [Spirochaetota bacterium]HQJ71532.1 polyprenyl synthetase family protein [Spirochaetota bacterium]
MKLPDVFNKYRDVIDADLKEVLTPFDLPLYNMMRYHLGWTDAEGRPTANGSGKALRPTLCLLACEAGGAPFDRAIPAATAVELVHNFSLIHDDIQDDDSERRHRPTVWKIWGKPQAINAGTAMNILANVALMRSEVRGLTTEQCQSMRSLLDEATLHLIEGQYLDISFEGRDDVTIEEYLTMIKGKTAALIACSMELGALAGSGDWQSARKLREFGECLGIAFQVRDDILGIWGDPGKTGKKQGNDIRQKKKSLPAVCALSEGDSKHKATVATIYGKETVTDDDVGIVLDIMNRMKIQERVQAVVDDYCGQAGCIIQGAGIDERNTACFEEILHYLTARDY